jgi:hypothetical protein
MDAPLVALVAHGNDALAYATAPDLLVSCSAFRQLRALDFAFADGHDRPPLTGSAAWLAELARRGASRLDLVVTPRVSASASAFPGGLDWEIAAVYPGLSTRWQPEWQHAEGAGLPLQLSFSESDSLPLRIATTTGSGLTQAQAELESALSTAQTFSDARGLGFGWRLADARTALANPSPRPVHHLDLLPRRGFPLAARQLVAAADRGWVFGGMGSWNDRSFTDNGEQDAFDEVSTSLLQALILAVASGVNAYRPLAAA